MRIFIQKILFPTLIFMSVFILFVYFLKNNTTKEAPNPYQIKAYKNTVALYNGEEIIKIYDNIVLNTLPEKDVANFKSGILVTSPEQAETYLMDFDN